MNESDVERAAHASATAVLLAWLIAHDPRVDLDDAAQLPLALMRYVPDEVIPEALHDLYRVSVRDYARNVLHLAGVMRAADRQAGR